MQDLQQQLQALDAQYQQLYSASMASAAAASSFTHFFDASGSQLALLHPNHQRYAAVTDEAQRLRHELETLRRRMELFDRCVSNIDGFLIGLARRRHPEPATLLPSPPPPQLNRVYMTKATSRELVRQCYLDICERKWPAGKRLSSGSHMLGWRDERFVDDASHELHFALSKRFALGSLDAFTKRTWEIVTSEKKHHARAVQRSTLGAKVLQVIDADTVLLQRRVYHAHLSTIACVNMLAFRVWTARGGCVIGFKSVTLPARSEDINSVFEYDAEQRSWFHDDPELKHVWVDTFQWWVFTDEGRVAEPLQGDEDGGAEPDRSAGLSVTMGGVTKNPDPKYIGYFLVEVLSCIMRWENAVAASQLSFLLGALETSRHEQQQQKEKA